MYDCRQTITAALYSVEYCFIILSFSGVYMKYFKLLPVAI
jgi:hypothetical protein